MVSVMGRVPAPLVVSALTQVGVPVTSQAQALLVVIWTAIAPPVAGASWWLGLTEKSH